MKRIIALTLLSCAVPACFADNDSGLYLGAGVGQFNVKVNNVDDIGPIVSQFDSDDTSFKAFGGWRFGRYIAAELAYIDFGGPDDDVDGVNVKAELDGFAPYVVGTLPLGPLEVFAKAGYFFYDLNVKVGGEKVASRSGSDEDFVYGGGLGLTLFEHLNARLEYERVDISDNLDHSDAVWLTGAWRF
ncbi:MAG: porin family protein [Steroidobacteraceae bacterium]|jgi:OOP family OmpA-OmpF porin|nr:porin family protein [Steroidobacteraceae bacterium]